MNKVEKAKAKFEASFGKGFFEVVPVKTFKGKKSEASFYQNMTVNVNMTGFDEADVFHEAAHAMDELMFDSQMEFAMFFRPFYSEFKKMKYFREFAAQYESKYQPSEVFAEAVAMAVANPQWEAGQKFAEAVRARLKP